MAYQIGGIKLSNWQLALLIGTPVAIGIGAYVYNRSYESLAESPSSTKTYRKSTDIIANLKALSNEDTELERQKKLTKQAVEKPRPNDSAGYKLEGNVCFRKGKFNDAIICYDHAIEMCPPGNVGDMAIYYQNRAAAYEMLKKWHQVKDDCTISLMHNPRYGKAYLRRAKAYEATGEIINCLEDITAACILEMFQNHNTIMYADRILKQTGRIDAEKAMMVRKPLLPSKNFVRSYLRSFVSDPLQIRDVPDGNNKKRPRGYKRAKLALAAEDYENVIAPCTEEIESTEAESQYKSEALLLRGTFYLLSGAFSDAKHDLDAIINNADADVELRANALIKRAALYIQMEEKDLGLADFDTAANIMPGNADIYHQRAQICILLDQLPYALKEFELAVKLSPNHAMAYVQKCYAEYRLSLLCNDQLRLMMVMKDFKNAIGRFPDCVECYSLMAQVLSDQQQFEQADQFFEMAIQLAPDNASLYVHRGIMFLQWKADIIGAMQYVHKALEVDVKCEMAYEMLGTVEVQRANMDHAVELFEHAIDLAKSRSELCHLYALRNAAVAQKNVTRRLGIDMKAVSALAQSSIPTPSEADLTPSI